MKIYKIICLASVIFISLCGCSTIESNKSENVNTSTVQSMVVSNTSSLNSSLDGTRIDTIAPTDTSTVAITEDDLKLGQIELNMGISDIKTVIGKEPINSSEKIDDIGKSTQLTYDDGTIIALLDDQVFSIYVTSPNYKTPRGLTVGDSVDKVIKLYGEPISRSESKWDYVGFGDYQVFHVHLRDKKVTGIEVNLVM